MSSSVSRLVPYLGAIVFGLVFALPVVWLFLTSLMTESEISSRPAVFIPSNPQWRNYASFVFQGEISNQNTVAIVLGVRNSLIVSTVVTATNVVFASFAGYGLARFQFRGSAILLFFYVATRMVPAAALFIPQYLLFSALGILDTLPSLMLAYIPISLPYAIWIMTSYFRLIPRELEDAARIDGCTRVQALRRIVLPLAVPALVTSALFCFILSWSEFLLAVVLTSSPSATPVTVAAAGFANAIRTEHSLLSAAGIVAIVPPVLLAMVFQRYIVGGLATGGIK